MSLKEIRTVSVTRKGQVSIPKEFREINMQENDSAAVLVFDNHIEIYPMSDIEERLGCAIASQNALAEHWDSPEEDAAWDHLKKHMEPRQNDNS
ncbi:AbrB/MazE/SpoVT family DNA-binding domain-containing protein [uncultured Methanolobus sp.]|uniref:AbrB/MazE/SpoVT family DNA-binding domain-containing protein n=1 Tax=uncultured Methanolobus sp. TaxID=218300 RepID=UPI002AABAA0C|nr:AbrB/MazE/SpoVT family DNA-binding domain-containing protein [uncultured Methanolobus sp.]